MKRRFIYLPLKFKYNYKISAGGYSSLYLNGESLWSWGYNNYGQIGDNSITQRNTPVSLLGTKKTFCSISNGYYFSTAIDNNSQVWAWGYNVYGSLGDNTATSRRTPVTVLGTRKTFCKIDSGYRHSMAIDKDGQVWAWGYNTSGQLGINAVTARSTPVSILGAKKTFCDITMFYQFTTGLDKNGQVWSWGNNNEGELGDNSITARCTPVSILGAKKTFCQISSGAYHTIGIDKNNQTWSWGYNIYGQLGDNSAVSKRTPVSILGAKKTFCKISAGHSHTLGIDKNGQVWGWGYNAYGQLGDNSLTVRSTPVSILGNKKTFCDISASVYFSLGIEKNGQVWGWGYNNLGQIGLGITLSGSSYSTYVPVEQDVNYLKISAGLINSMSIDKNGQVWGWGYNGYGQLGNNATENKSTPVSILGAKKTFCQISSGYYHTIVLDKNGQVWTWGSGTSGQLGDNSAVSRKTPVSILGTKKTFCQISGGQTHSIGLDKTGQVWSWGYNAYGQLGDNSVTQKSTPVSILGAKKTFCQISSGSNHSLGIDKTGQVWAWGYNLYGQIGNNVAGSASYCTPVSILGAKKTFCEIRGGSIHTVGLDKNGQVWAWGYNLYGQIGDNSTISKNTPVSILGAKKTFCKIEAGANHSLAIDKTGKIWTWGYNNEGQLGDNTLVSKRTPVLILGIRSKTFCEIAAQGDFNLAIDKSGKTWAWGKNTTGQLGFIYNTATPMRIYYF